MMGEEQSVLEKLATIDRRVLYVIFFVVLLLANVFKFSLPIVVHPEAKAVYDAIEELHEGSSVIYSCDSDIGGYSESGPPQVAVMNHLLMRPLKIIIVACGEPTGLLVALNVLRDVDQDLLNKKEYGVDYVLLGFLPGEESAVAALASTPFEKLFPFDYEGNILSELPIINEVRSSEDISLVLDAPYGDIAFWMRHWGAPLEIPVAFLMTTGYLPAVMPFYQSGQLLGMVVGSPGGAEYEQLIGKIGTSLQTTSIMSVMGLLCIACMICANVITFFRKEEKNKIGERR